MKCSRCGRPIYSAEARRWGMGATCRRKAGLGGVDGRRGARVNVVIGSAIHTGPGEAPPILNAGPVLDAVFAASSPESVAAAGRDAEDRRMREVLNRRPRRTPARKKTARGRPVFPGGLAFGAGTAREIHGTVMDDEEDGKEEMPF